MFIAPFPDAAPEPEDVEQGGGGHAAVEESCVSGETKSCDSTYPELNGVGICKSPVQTCNVEGTGYGACSGEVVPQFEDCSTEADENCDGHGCTGEHLQSTSFGGSGEQRGSTLAAREDAVIVAGSASGAIDFGSGMTEEMGEPGNLDSFVAMLGGDGQLRWSRRFADNVTRGVAIAPNGDVVFTGGVAGEVDFGDGPLSGYGNGEDVFIARLNAAGEHLWSRRVGNGANQFANAVAVDAAGNAIVTGGFWGKLDFGVRNGGEHDAIESAGGCDAFLAKFDSEGALIWAKRFGDGPHHQEGTGVAVDGEGNIVAVGWFSGRVSFDGSSLESRGETDLFAVKLNAAGDHLWSRSASSTDAAQATGVAIDGSGNIFVTGSFRSSITVGDTTYQTASDKDVVLIKLNDHGRPIWSKAFGDSADQEGVGVAVDSAGDVLLTGFFLGHIDFGTGPLTATGAKDGFLAKLAPSGAPLWARSFGDSGEQSGTAVAADPIGNAWATGYFSGGADFGGEELASRGARDAFVARFGP